jgi:hypothetical protein
LTNSNHSSRERDGARLRFLDIAGR